jgi:hypothetical protein
MHVRMVAPAFLLFLLGVPSFAQSQTKSAALHVNQSVVVPVEAAVKPVSEFLANLDINSLAVSYTYGKNIEMQRDVLAKACNFAKQTAQRLRQRDSLGLAVILSQTLGDIRIVVRDIGTTLGDAGQNSNSPAAVRAATASLQLIVPLDAASAALDERVQQIAMASDTRCR